MVCYINIVKMSFEQLLKHDSVSFFNKLFLEFFFLLHFTVGNFKEHFGKKSASNPLGMEPKFGPKYKMYIGRKNPKLYL